MKKQEKLKTSQYNVAVRFGKDVGLYNTRTSAYLLLHDITKPEIKWLIDGESTHNFYQKLKTLPLAIRKVLVDGGFIIDKNFNEFEYLRYLQKSLRFATHRLGIVILPTLACNLSCVYCYEKEKPIHMSEETAKKIINYIRYSLKEGVKDIGITWYGGEPLLKYDLICWLSSRIQQLCRENKAKFRITLITNGVLLSLKRLNRLKKLGLKDIQITIDGPRAIHDKRKPAKDGKSSFDRILNNLQLISPYIPIDIRVNVDNSNENYIKDLVDILSKLNLPKSTRIYFENVRGEGRACKNSCVFSNLFDNKGFAKKALQMEHYAHQKGLTLLAFPENAPKMCSATADNALVIEPDGTLQKCYTLVGKKKESIGNVSDGIIYNENTLKWSSFDPFNLPKCKKCKFMPICWGGCPLRALKDKTIKSCPTLRYNTKDLLRLMSKEKNVI